MKKLILGALLSTVMVGSVGIQAFADNAGNVGKDITNLDKNMKIIDFKEGDNYTAKPIELKEGEILSATIDATGMVSTKIESGVDFKIGKYTFEEFLKLSEKEQEKLMEEFQIKIVKATELEKATELK